MALCRCGESANKPYCDGTHKKVGFSSAKADDRTEDKMVDFAGAEITIHDNRGLCAHAGVCTDGLPSVFRMKEEPWIHPDSADPGDIEAVIDKCPSGALRYSIAASREESGDVKPAIFIAPNGPYVVSGSPHLQDCELGDGATGERLTFCRCGGSKNKPYCDGSHWYNNFRDDDN